MKKLFAILIVLSLPTTAFASTQVLMGNSQAGANTYALVASGGGNNSGVHSDTFPVSGTLANLRVYTDVAPGGTTVKTGAISQNGSDSALNCTITGAAQTCTDTTDSLSVSAGDYINMHLTNTSGTPTTGDYSWSVEFTPTNANDTVLLGATLNNGNNTRTWLPFSGFTATGEANLLQAIPEAGTLDTFTLGYPSFTSGSMEWNIWVNSASSTLDCTGAGGSTSCADSTHSVNVSQGDTVSVSQVPFSPGTSVRPGFGVRYVPTTAGDFPVLAGSIGGIDSIAGSTAYLPFSGGYVRKTTEGSTTQVVGTAFTVSSMSLVRAAGPGSGKAVTYTLRVNGADSALACSLSGTGSGAGITTNTCTGSVSLSPGDLVDWSTALSSSGTTAHVAIGTVGWIPSYSCGFGSPIPGGKCQGFITSGTSWTVPSDWSSTNTIQAIGAGGNGGGGAGSGGGGGAYAGIVNQALTPSSSVTVQIGAGGGGPGSTGDTYLKDNSGTTVLLARGGTTPTTSTGGAGGDTANSVGSTKYAGGAGGGHQFGSGGGGGGSAGPSGAGKAGGRGGYQESGGAGGGGSNGGSSTAGTGSSGYSGYAGGNGTGGTGGGVGGVGSGVPGSPGIAGGGGGGGANGGLGAAGGSDTAFDATHGAGGGGGGNGSDIDTTASGAGGTYGGGGAGGGHYGSHTSAGGTGGAGIIAITYSVAPQVTTDIATAVGATSAVLNATLDADKGLGASQYGFAYSTNSSLSSGVSTSTLGTLSGPTYFNAVINSLSLNTTYYFRAYATNSIGTGYGSIQSFSTGNTTSTSVVRLFGGFKIKFLGGRMILY